ncbi:MAG: two-component regulator propeller domain-containing protein [Verrucomicrobiota bacterium]
MQHPIPWRWLLSVVAGLAIAVPAAGAGPSWFARTWQSDVGLPDNSVVGIDQTPDGFLWVATKTGLVRFDGLQFRQFPLTAAGVPVGMIHALLADRRGRLWVALEGQIVVCMEPGRPATVFHLKKGLLDKGTGMMLEDGEGAVWVTYVSGEGDGEVLRIQDGQARLFATADGLPEAGDCQLAVDTGGRLWYSRGDQVGIFRDGKFRPLEKAGVQRITSARSGGIWGYSRVGLYKFREGGSPVKVVTTPPTLANASPTIFHEDRTGRLLIGTSEAGLFSYDDTDFTTLPTAHQTILSLKEDREGNLWVGTRGGGLNQLKPRLVDLLATSTGTPLEAVRSVCQDTGGQLWAVVWQKGEVLRSAGRTFAPMSAKDGWSESNAQCVAADPQGGVWIGTQYIGLHHWQNGGVNEILNMTNGLISSRVNALLTIPTGELWIAAGFAELPPHFLQRRRAGQFQTFSLPEGSGPVVALAMDAAGDCWAATTKGRLLRVRHDVLTDETGSMPPGVGTLRCLLGTADGSLWIGFGGQGLGRLKGGRFSRCRMNQGLRDDYISNILADGLGRLWLAGNRGIFNVREADLDDLEQGRATRVHSVGYGRTDGLPGLQASYDSCPGAFCGTDGRLFFAMQSGVAAVYPDSFKESPQAPAVVIERVILNGKSVAAYQADADLADSSAAVPVELGQAGAHLRLPPGQRQVEIAFTALSFTKPESLGFKYRLQPLEETWVEAGTRRTAIYSQLAPGRYHFEVSACNSDGVWNPAASALDLTAEAYWWETAWFRVGAGVFMIAGLVGGVFWVTRRRARRKLERLLAQQALQRERLRIAHDIHDDVGASLTRISLLSQAALEDAHLGRDAKPNLGRIYQTTRALTGTLDEIVWAINPSHDTLDSLATFFAEWAGEFLEPSGLDLRLDIPVRLPDWAIAADVRHSLFLAFKEALNNVMKHARASEVTVAMRVMDHGIELSIRDNGCGFVVPDLAAPGPASGTDAGRDGLANMKHRLAQAGGCCIIESAPGQGTTVSLIMNLI